MLATQQQQANQAISRKYCEGDFGEATDDGGSDSDSDSDNGASWVERAAAEQTGHGLVVDGIVYGRGVRQGQVGTAVRRERNRRVSQK
ncbi:hypothetical protein CTA1_9844 [Colletotrichum tanaceti]|uniref:Uncharacterized protein n=1 Tax=Colletotrichum tanaceti TaxID=1306861 RepID=A0A4V6Y9G7_9PEZI|nr:hypothetical protein CTA1_9844 [Colletotrichum tanaceti]